ncbi:MAG TPA: helix-turn-helix transcriptional regulator [Verrucomicrobiae bacterium]|nr:helix-turn-helix transcriptional regulator [Verrucomicrobiae bacterium]
MGSKKPWDRRRKRVHALLRAVREEAGLTQAALAKRLNVDQSFVSRLERGERRLDLVEVLDLCRACGLPFRTFVQRFEEDRL